MDDAFTARHVRHRAVPRTNRTPATSSRAYQSKSTRVESGQYCYAIKCRKGNLLEGGWLPEQLIFLGCQHPHTREWHQQGGLLRWFCVSCAAGRNIGSIKNRTATEESFGAVYRRGLYTLHLGLQAADTVAIKARGAALGSTGMIAFGAVMGSPATRALYLGFASAGAAGW